MSDAHKQSTSGLQREIPAARHAPAATNADYPELAKRLRERHRTLREEIHATLLRADAERYADIADRISDSEDRSLAELLAGVSHAEVTRDAEEISDIETALKRIAAGTYGICVQCHALIAQQRLSAYPTAKRCLSCQQLHEQRA